MKRSVTVCVVISTLAVGACGGSSGDDTTPTDNPPAETTSTTAQAPAPTDAPTSTATTPSTSTTTTTTTTAPAASAASTTVDPLTEIGVLLQQALEDGEIAITNAAADPNSLEATKAIGRFYSGGALAGILEDVGALASEGLVARNNPDVPQVVEIQSAPRYVDPTDLTIVEARVCRVDAAIVYLPSPNASGAETIVNDTIRRIVALSVFKFENGFWRLDSGRTLSNSVGETTCDDA